MTCDGATWNRSMWHLFDIFGRKEKVACGRHHYNRTRSFSLLRIRLSTSGKMREKQVCPNMHENPRRACYCWSHDIAKKCDEMHNTQGDAPYKQGCCSSFWFQKTESELCVLATKRWDTWRSLFLPRGDIARKHKRRHWALWKGWEVRSKPWHRSASQKPQDLGGPQKSHPKKAQLKVLMWVFQYNVWHYICWSTWQHCFSVKQVRSNSLMDIVSFLQLTKLGFVGCPEYKTALTNIIIKLYVLTRIHFDVKSWNAKWDDTRRVLWIVPWGPCNKPLFFFNEWQLHVCAMSLWYALRSPISWMHCAINVLAARFWLPRFMIVSVVLLDSFGWPPWARASYENHEIPHNRARNLSLYTATTIEINSRKASKSSLVLLTYRCTKTQHELLLWSAPVNDRCCAEL